MIIFFFPLELLKKKSCFLQDIACKKLYSSFSLKKLPRKKFPLVFKFFLCFFLLETPFFHRILRVKNYIPHYLSKSCPKWIFFFTFLHKIAQIRNISSLLFLKNCPGIIFFLFSLSEKLLTKIFLIFFFLINCPEIFFLIFFGKIDSKNYFILVVSGIIQK